MDRLLISSNVNWYKISLSCTFLLSSLNHPPSLSFPHFLSLTFFPSLSVPHFLSQSLRLPYLFFSIVRTSVRMVQRGRAALPWIPLLHNPLSFPLCPDQLQGHLSWHPSRGLLSYRAQWIRGTRTYCSVLKAVLTLSPPHQYLGCAYMECCLREPNIYLNYPLQHLINILEEG